MTPVGEGLYELLFRLSMRFGKYIMVFSESMLRGKSMSQQKLVRRKQISHQIHPLLCVISTLGEHEPGIFHDAGQIFSLTRCMISLVVLNHTF